MQTDIINHSDLTATQLFHLLRKQELTLAGNRKLKIYGLPGCSAGKRMKKENRVFFKHESHALQAGYRPCSVCLRKAYKTWKERKKQVENAATTRQF
jgi:methylphosphotriester-DNA--protein-cysteine methyltransferase